MLTDLHLNDNPLTLGFIKSFGS